MTTALSERPATLPSLITFSSPIPGFPTDREFDVVALDAHGVLYALRSRQTPGLRFIVAAPGRFFPEYRPTLLPGDVESLGVVSGDEVLVLVVVTATDSIADATANLLAPIIIAAKTATAVQVVLPDAELPLRAPLLVPAS